MVSFRKCSAISRKKVRLLHTHHVIYIIYSMVGRSITSIFDLGGILTSALCASVNMVPRVGYRLWTSYHTISAMDLPTIQCILHIIAFGYMLQNLVHNSPKNGSVMACKYHKKKLSPTGMVSFLTVAPAAKRILHIVQQGIGTIYY